MRLGISEQHHIRQAVLELDPHAEIRLFGSRTRDDAKGGDIDLLIISTVLDRRKLRVLRLRLQDRLGERKIDIVVSSPELMDPFARLAYEQGVSL